MQGLGQLATASIDGFFRTLSQLTTMDQTSGHQAELQRLYNEVLPSEVDFTDLPFHSTMIKIHALAGRFGNPRDIRWYRQRLSIQEHISFAQRMVQAAQEGYRHTQHRKVHRWILRSSVYPLSLGPLASASVIADCLTIVAIDLGCDIPSIATVEERCLQILSVQGWSLSRFSSLIGLKPWLNPEVKLDHLEVQGYKRVVPICNLSGARRGPRDDLSTLTCCQGLKFQVLVLVPRRRTLHFRSYLRRQPTEHVFLDLTHRPGT